MAYWDSVWHEISNNFEDVKVGGGRSEERRGEERPADIINQCNYLRADVVIKFYKISPVRELELLNPVCLDLTWGISD